MSVTQLSSSNLNPIFGVVLLGWFTAVGQNACAQAVPSQANIDASAQRRLQETAREAQRQRRIEEQLAILAPALHPPELAGTNGPILARKALAALARLRDEGIPPNDALVRAVRSKNLPAPQVAQATTYLRSLFNKNSSVLDADLLELLAAGKDPAPKITIPPFQP